MDLVPDSDSESEEGDKNVHQNKIYLPGNPMEEDEELVCDNEAYWMYHQAQTGVSCYIAHSHVEN